MPRPGQRARRLPHAERAAWGSLSRDQIVGVARTMLARTGLPGLTIRALADELGVAPMSVYRHVTNKIDLLSEIVDQMLAERWRPDTDEADWRGWIVAAADRLRRFVVDEPAAREVYLDHPVVSPAAVARMDEMVGVLGRGLGDQQLADEVYVVVQTYTIGFATIQAARAQWRPRGAVDHELAVRVAAFSRGERFRDGVSYILAGASANR
jgi:AcrR family transcriptional regulator